MKMQKAYQSFSDTAEIDIFRHKKILFLAVFQCIRRFLIAEHQQC